MKYNTDLSLPVLQLCFHNPHPNPRACMCSCVCASAVRERKRRSEREWGRDALYVCAYEEWYLSFGLLEGPHFPTPSTLYVIPQTALQPSTALHRTTQRSSQARQNHSVPRRQYLHYDPSQQRNTVKIKWLWIILLLNELTKWMRPW